MTAELCAGCPLRNGAPQSLTDRQADVLRAIAGLLTRRGTPPTFAEIATAIGVRSSNTVWGLVTELHTKGWIHRRKATRQSIELTPAAVAWLATHHKGKR